VASPTVAHVSHASLPWLARVTAVSCLFGAEAIHTAVIAEYIQEWLPAGLFFLVLSLVQGLLAVALIAAPSRRLERVIIGVSLGTVALWLLSRSVGIPIGPMAWIAEPIGRADIVATALELVTAAVLLATTTVTTSTRRSADAYCRALVIISAVFVLITFGQIGISGPH